MSQQNLKKNLNKRSKKSNKQNKKQNKKQNRKVKGGYQPSDPSTKQYYSDYSGTTFPQDAIEKSDLVCNYSGAYGGALSAEDLNKMSLKGNLPMVKDPLHSVGGANKTLYKLRNKSNKRNSKKQTQRAGGLVSSLINKVKKTLNQDSNMIDLNNSLEQYDSKLNLLEKQLEEVQANHNNNDNTMKEIMQQREDERLQQNLEKQNQNNLEQQLTQNHDTISQAAEQMEQSVNSSNNELKGGNKLTPAQVSNSIKSNGGHTYSNMSRGDGGVNANLSVMNVNQQGQISGKTTEVNLIPGTKLTGGSKKQKREVRNSKWIEEVKQVMKTQNLTYGKALKIASENRKKNNNKK
jgi:hypothetical protein